MARQAGQPNEGYGQRRATSQGARRSNVQEEKGKLLCVRLPRPLGRRVPQAGQPRCFSQARRRGQKLELLVEVQRAKPTMEFLLRSADYSSALELHDSTRAIVRRELSGR